MAEVQNELVKEFGQGSVRVAVMKNAKGYLNVRPYRTFFWQAKGEVYESSRFPVSDMPELMHWMGEAEKFVASQRSTMTAKA